MEDEINTMKERDVWYLAKLPPNTIPVGCRWVYTLKMDESGKVVRYKARLVAQGFKQVRGDSYEETFSPVVNFSIIRLFFALLVVQENWVHVQCDIKGAYLYAPLKEAIYMSQPQGFIDFKKQDFYCKLNKAIYGLKQSGREWFYEINKVLTSLGFLKLGCCNCVYTFDSFIVLLLHVDDIVIFGKNQCNIDILSC